MTARGARDFVVTYRSRPSALVEVLLRVVDVPADVTREAVELALEAWRDWDRWQARVRPGAVIAVRPARSSDLPGAHRVTWEDFAPGTRTITVRVPGELHAAVSRIARGRGVSLVGLVDGLLRDLAELEGEAVPAPIRAPRRPVLYEDVALPLEGAGLES